MGCLPRSDLSGQVSSLYGSDSGFSSLTLDVSLARRLSYRSRFLLPPFVLLAFVYPSLPRPATLLPARLRRLSTSTTPLPPDSSPKVLSGIVIPQGQQPATVQSVQIALADFSALSTLVQASWPPGWVALVRAKLDGGGWRVVTRALLGIWAVWVFGSLVMGLRIVSSSNSTRRASLFAKSRHPRCCSSLS